MLPQVVLKFTATGPQAVVAVRVGPRRVLRRCDLTSSATKLYSNNDSCYQLLLVQSVLEVNRSLVNGQSPNP